VEPPRRDVCLVLPHPSASGDGGAKPETETTPRPLSLLFVGFLLVCTPRVLPESSGGALLSLSLSLSASIMSICAQLVL
jgi:hypothetical protein